MCAALDTQIDRCPMAQRLLISWSMTVLALSISETALIPANTLLMLLLPDMPHACGVIVTTYSMHILRAELAVAMKCAGNA